MLRDSYRFQLLAPSEITTPSLWGAIAPNADLYEHYLSSLQRLRASTYLDDGAIQIEQIDHSGRFRMRQDEQCWHFLLVDSEHQVVGCVRYLAHPNTASFEDLWIAQSPLALDSVWGLKLRGAVKSDLCWARERNLAFIEVGGWAIDLGYRHTRAALEVMLASFAWSQLIGGGLGCSTATFRNDSASILRRIGGTSLEYEGEALPPYNDPRYGCRMEVLHFHFQSFDARFRKIVDDIRLHLEHSTVIQRPLDSFKELSELVKTEESLQALHCALQNAGQPRELSSPADLPYGTQDAVRLAGGWSDDPL